MQFDSHYKMSQFRPSCDCADLVEGLRSVGNDENDDMCFERKASAFKDFCKNALETDNENLIRARFSCPDACVEVC